MSRLIGYTRDTRLVNQKTTNSDDFTPSDFEIYSPLIGILFVLFSYLLLWIS